MKLILAFLALVSLSGCAGYDTSYSLNVSDGKQSIGIGATFHPTYTTSIHSFSK